MTRFVALLRGINVGGRNPVAMSDLADGFRDAGFSDVRTHLQSGNVVFSTPRAGGSRLESSLEQILERRYDFEIPVIVRSRDEMAAVVEGAPKSHRSADMRSEVFFLKHPKDVDDVFAQIPPLREGVDSVQVGEGVIYFSRVRAQATKTRISRFMGMPVFKQLTVRSWGTTTRILTMLDEVS